VRGKKLRRGALHFPELSNRLPPNHIQQRDHQPSEQPPHQCRPGCAPWKIRCQLAGPAHVAFNGVARRDVHALNSKNAGMINSDHSFVFSLRE
jgi:hypothetical protein